MLISERDVIDGARILRPIGRIKATSAWSAPGRRGENWRERVLEDLVRRAEDVDADAIIALDYDVEPVEGGEHGLFLERVRATGIAVRLAQAA